MNINDFYNGNPLLPKSGVRKYLTEEQQLEFIKCAEDPVYFAQNYFYAVHQEHGLMQITPYDYQVDAIRKFNEKNRLIMLTARQVGKLLCNNSRIPLYNGGYTTMGEIKVGDVIIGSDGNPTTVTYKSPLQKPKMFKVTFEDGVTVDACEDHLWTVVNRINHRKVETKDTKTLFKDYIKTNSRGYPEYRYTIPNIKPVNYPKKDVNIDPYVLGIWLGDGTKNSTQLTSHVDHVEFYESQGIQFGKDVSDSRRNNLFTARILNTSIEDLRSYNLIQNKHIPHDYLYGSIDQRLALLQGIMDTDGHVRKNGLCEIQLTDKVPQLIDDVYQLLCSLGIKVFRSNFINEKFETSSTRLTFTPPCGMQVVRMPHKAERLKSERPNELYTNSRSIIKIEKIEDAEGHCIQVDAPDHLFAVTNSYVLTHNTTIATAIILHAALFNKNKNIALLANLQATAIEILDRIKEAFENLPEFLKQGIKIWNKKTIKFENGCTIFANASKGSSIRGKSIYMLYVDECAFVDNWNDFAASTLPTITSNKNAKIIYTSTPNGLNHFYEYCELASKGKNGFAYVEVPWYKVDGRDEEWKEKTLQDMNYDYERFQVEQECQFLGSSGTLISGAALKRLEAKTPVHIHDNLKIYEPKQGNHIYAMIVDSSEGKGLDYSAFSVIDVTSAPYRQVATFRSNQITPQDYARIINVVAKQYNEPYILVELNAAAGAIVADLLFWDYEYENLLMTESAGRAGKKISSGFGGNKVDRGVITSTAVKATGCTMLKLLIEQNQLEIRDKETIFELSTFSKKGKSYEAEEGKHDDLVMGLVLFGWLTVQEYFKQITDVDINNNLKEIGDQDVEDYVSGLGIMVINDGLEEDYAPAW